MTTSSSSRMDEDQPPQDDNEYYEYSFQNCPPNLKPAFKHYANESLTNIQERVKCAIRNVDIENALYHIGILSRYLELKYPITRRVRRDLCRLSLTLLFEYPLDLSHQTTVMKVCTKLIKKGNLSTVGLELDWRPFYQLYKSVHYSGRDGATQSDKSTLYRSHASQLSELMAKANVYFPSSSFAQILDELLPFLNPHDIYYSLSLSLLIALLPCKQAWVPPQLRAYKLGFSLNSAVLQQKHVADMPELLVFLLDQLFNETLWTKRAPGQIVQLLLEIVTPNREFAPYFRPFASEFFHLLYLNTELPINGKYCALQRCSRLQQNRTSAAATLRFTNLGGDVQNFVLFLVNLCDNGGDADPVQQMFTQFFATTSNYFYPDQIKRRLTQFHITLTTVLTSFTLNYAMRYFSELRGYDNANCAAYLDIPLALRQNVYSWYAKCDRTHPLFRPAADQFKLKPSPALFAAVLPIIRWSIYAKSSIIQFAGYTAVRALATVFPRALMTWAADEIPACLQSVTESHRISIGIGLLHTLTPTLLNRYLLPDVQPLFVEFMQLMLFAIDPSLTQHCTQALAFLDTVFTKVPLVSAKDRSYSEQKSDGDFEDSEHYSDAQGKNATYAFDSFVVAFTDKIVDYARASSTTLSSLKNSGSASDTSGIKNFMPRSNRILLKKFKKCVYSFWFALSQSLYVECRDRVLAIIDEPQCGSLGGIILSGSVYPYPQLSLPLYLPRIFCKFVHLKNQKKSLSEAQLAEHLAAYAPQLFELRGSKEVIIYYLGLLEAVLVAAHSHVKSYIPLLASVITLCIESELPEVKKYAGPLLQVIVVTLVRETPLEARSCSPDRWKEDGTWAHWREWAQFAEIEMKGLLDTWRPDLKLKWFYPQQSDFDAVQQLMNFVLTKPLQDMQTFMTMRETAADADANDDVVNVNVNAEQLLEYVRVLYHFCYGLGHLGDFDTDSTAQSLPTVAEDNFFTLTQDDKGERYWMYRPSKNVDDAVYGALNKLRSTLKIPVFVEYKNVSLRTAFARLAVRLFQKLSQFSDTSEHIMDTTDLPDVENTEGAVMVDMAEEKSAGSAGASAISEASRLLPPKLANINLKELFLKHAAAAAGLNGLKNDEEEEAMKRSRSALKKSRLFPGVSKVLVWLNTLVNILMNHDGVMWGVVANYASATGGPLAKHNFNMDIVTGHRHTTRAVFVTQEHALTLKRLYFLFTYNGYTTDVRALVDELVKCSICEFENVRTRAIHAVISGRSVYNYRSGLEYAMRFWLNILRQPKAEKAQLLGAIRALSHGDMMSQLILRSHDRRLQFVTTLLNCSMHREPAVQTAIYNLFFVCFNSERYRTVCLPPKLATDADRRQQLQAINETFVREHERYQTELVRIANREQLYKKNASSTSLSPQNLNDTDSVTSQQSSQRSSTTSTIDSASFVKIPSTPNDPVVGSLSSLINNLDFASLKIDWANLPFDLANVTPQALSRFLAQQGFNLPSRMFDSLSQSQLQSIVDSSKLSKFVRAKLTTAQPEPQQIATKRVKPKESVQIHWKYSLMASILLWKSLRPNFAPTREVVEFMLSLIGNKIPTLNRVAISALSVILHTYVPRVHYTQVLKDATQFPVEHTFGWRSAQLLPGVNRRVININDLRVAPPLYMRPTVQLDSECVSLLHAFLANHMDVLCKALVDDHPNIPDPSAPPQNRNSSEKQLRNLVQIPLLWPYDGYDVLVNDWESKHFILVADILRCKWPNSEKDKDWQCDDKLWSLVLNEFQVHAQNMKEKENQLAGAEILAGVLRAYHQFAAMHELPKDVNVAYLEQTVCAPLLKALQNCPPESEDAWCSAIRCGLANSDARNIDWFTRSILKLFADNLQIQHVSKEVASNDGGGNGGINTKEFISADKQVRCIRYATEVILSYGYRAEPLWRYALSAMTQKMNQLQTDKKQSVDYAVFDCFFTNTYVSVRSDIGIVLSQIMRCVRGQPQSLLSDYDCVKSDAQLEALLDVIESQYAELWQKRMQEQAQKQQLANEQKEKDDDDDDKCSQKYNRLLETLCFWVQKCYLSLNVVYYQTLWVRLLPLILLGQFGEDKKTAEVVKNTVQLFGWMPLHEPQVLAVLDVLLNTTTQTPKLINNTQWQIRKHVLQFLLHFISRNAVILDKNAKYQQLVVEYLAEHALGDKQLEVRVQARDTLSALIQATNLKQANTVSVLFARFQKLARTKLPKRDYETGTTDAAADKKLALKMRKKHSGILGLSALILSVPYTVPQWLPEVLSFVAIFDRERAPIGTTTKQTVAEFKRTHQDEWHIFKKQFTMDQLANIQDASSTSYFL